MERRIIKLRAWDAAQGTLTPVADLAQLTDPALHITQFTGLYDQYGREVWEGDVLRQRWSEADADESYEAVLHHLVGIEKGAYGSSVTGADFEPYYNVSPDGCEVVGNRFTDADLLELNAQW